MIKTVQFRLFPSEKQENLLHEIFTIYNRIKRIGYQLLFYGEQAIQQKLMAICANNPYVNTILINNQAKSEAQKTWLYKQRSFLKDKIKVIQKKIKEVKTRNRKDRRLRGLFARVSSLQGKLSSLKLKPVVFGGKKLFRDRILGNISKEEFKIRRDSSFACIGKTQNNRKNLNLKILTTNELKIHRFSKEKGRKWLVVPFMVNDRQREWLRELYQAEKYTVCVKRKFVRKELRYYALVTYELPARPINYGFEKGAIGLDLNYEHTALSNINENGNLLSYQRISFRNLHTLRKNKRKEYASFKLDKIINYCINKRKGIVIEDLSFNQIFSYNKKLNRKLSNFRTSMLNLLERKCSKKGVALRRVHPAYTSLIGKYKYSRSHNLSPHVLASYVIARRGLGFKEELPPIHEWVLSQVREFIEPRLKQSSPYREWAQIHDLFKHCGITSFRTPEVMRKVLFLKDVLNSATSARPDNLRAGLSPTGKIEDYYEFWNAVNSCQCS